MEGGNERITQGPPDPCGHTQAGSSNPCHQYRPAWHRQCSVYARVLNVHVNPRQSCTCSPPKSCVNKPVPDFKSPMAGEASSRTARAEARQRPAGLLGQRPAKDQQDCSGRGPPKTSRTARAEARQRPAGLLGQRPAKDQQDCSGRGPPKTSRTARAEARQRPAGLLGQRPAKDQQDCSGRGPPKTSRTARAEARQRPAAVISSPTHPRPDHPGRK
ncbi:hypothetical protein ACOMHN_006695 [Nucella lapillus]